ncbi:MAG TPA: hypothetical protein VHX15_03255 [Frankiaceae bacterium]|nr:hypothetical protein [Frankiaceae bacterium]
MKAIVIGFGGGDGVGDGVGLGVADALLLAGLAALVGVPPPLEQPAATTAAAMRQPPRAIERVRR